MTEAALPPQVLQVPDWVAPTLHEAFAHKNIDIRDKELSYYDRSDRYIAIIKDSGAPRAVRGSISGNPIWEVEINKMTHKVERMSIAR